MLFSFSLTKDRGVKKRLVVAFNLYVNIVRYNGVNQKACSMKSHFPNVLFSKSSAVARPLRRVGGKGEAGCVGCVASMVLHFVFV